MISGMGFMLARSRAPSLRRKCASSARVREDLCVPDVREGAEDGPRAPDGVQPGPSRWHPLRTVPYCIVTMIGAVLPSREIRNKPILSSTYLFEGSCHGPLSLASRVL